MAIHGYAVHLETGRLHSLRLHPTHGVKKGTAAEGSASEARQRKEASEEILLTVSMSERRDDVKANQFGTRDCNTMSNETASAE